MKQRRFGSELSSPKTLDRCPASRLSSRHLRTLAVFSLALATLACSFFNTVAPPSSDAIVIRRHMPTLTPTAIPVESEALESVAVAPPPPPSPTSTPSLTPTFSPSSVETTASNNPDNQTINEPPLLTAAVILNVRTGPDLAYDIVGQLAEGQSVRVTGRNPVGSWWQIEYPPGSGALAWVSAGVEYSTVSRAGEVLVALAPATPTATVTATATPTATASPVVAVQPTRPAPPVVRREPTPDVMKIFKVPTYVRPSVN